MILGVDAGGTKTDAIVVGRHGAVLAFVRGGGANHEAIGWVQAQERLRSATVEALEMAGVAPESVAASAWGLAALDWPSDEIRYRGIIADLGFPDPALVVNDAFLALARALTTVLVWRSCPEPGLWSSAGRPTERRRELSESAPDGAIGAPVETSLARLRRPSRHSTWASVRRRRSLSSRCSAPGSLL